MRSPDDSWTNVLIWVCDNLKFPTTRAVQNTNYDVNEFVRTFDLIQYTWTLGNRMPGIIKIIKTMFSAAMKKMFLFFFPCAFILWLLKSLSGITYVVVRLSKTKQIIEHVIKTVTRIILAYTCKRAGSLIRVLYPSSNMTFNYLITLSDDVLITFGTSDFPRFLVFFFFFFSTEARLPLLLRSSRF